MSGIELEPEDLYPPQSAGGPLVPPHLHEHFVRRAERSSNGNGIADAEMGALADLINDYKRRGSERQEVEVAASFLSRHGVTVMMAAVSAIFSGMLSAGGVWLGIRDELATQRNDIANLKVAIHDIVETNTKVREKYIPMVEQQANTNDRQDGNMQSLRDSILRLSNVVDTQAKSVAETHEDIAVLKTLFNNRFPPH